MIKDEKRIYDTSITFLRGMDGNRRADLLDLFEQGQQAAKLVNVSVRGGSCGETRPTFECIPLYFNSDKTRDYFETNNVQGGIVYRRIGRDVLQVAIGGRFFEIDEITHGVRENTPPDGGNPSDRDHVYFVQAGQNLVAQDGLSTPIIWNNSLVGARSNVLNNQIDVGLMMWYVQFRLFKVGLDKIQIYAGDIDGAFTFANPTGDPTYFNEVNYPTGGGSIPVPAEIGNIVAITAIPYNGSTTGWGELLVIGQRGIVTYQVAVPRALWADTTGFSQLILRDVGGTSQASVISHNAFVFFRSWDGIRELRMSQQQDQDYGQNPISREVDPWLNEDNGELLDFCTGGVFNNRLFMTVNPEFDPAYKVRNNGFVVMDFDVLSGFRRKEPPVWEGLWTGVNPTVVFSGVINNHETMYVLSRDDDGRNRLYRLNKQGDFDIDPNGRPVRVKSVIETPAYTFGSPYSLKIHKGVDLWFDEIRGKLDIKAFYRNDTDPMWRELGPYQACAEDKICLMGCKNTPNLAKQGRNRCWFDPPEGECNEESVDDNENNTRFYTCQLKFEIEGRFRLRQIRFHAYNVEAESPDGNREPECDEFKAPCLTQTVCNPTDFEYKIVGKDFVQEPPECPLPQLVDCEDILGEWSAFTAWEPDASTIPCGEDFCQTRARSREITNTCDGFVRIATQTEEQCAVGTLGCP